MRIKTGAGRLTMKDIAEYTHGQLIGNAADGFEYICTDSREAGEDSLFVAFRGESADGHDYIKAAFASGCRCFLSERADVIPWGSSAVIVPDSTDALIEISACYRERTDCIRIGITGSVGKTTTKEFVSSVVSTRFRTHKTTGNYNSTIGMPLTLAETPCYTNVSVLEMAMSGPGEISKMSKAACPDIAVITNIGSSHMEQLGSRENIFRAKLEILDGLKKGGTLVINYDDDFLKNLKFPEIKTVSIGIDNKDAGYTAFNITFSGNKTVFDVKTPHSIIHDIEIPVIGKHNVYAALIAVAVGGIIGIDENGIREGLSSYIGVGLRQEFVEIDGIKIIKDCYNASPESMKAAIEVLTSFKREDNRVIALLGDMKELGKETESLHRKVGKMVAAGGVDMLFTIGGLAKYIASGALENGMNEEQIFVNVDESTYAATAWELWRVLKKGDILLVKASRAIRAERVIECMTSLAKNEHH